MAKRIIKPGKPQQKYKGVCHACGCEFECEEEDVDGGSENGPYTMCPETKCWTDVDLREIPPRKRKEK